ncbi:MAG: hypothetical protein GF400_03550 [Candidatus Eisenbacteria bacterium]|nr:hypothetical protein [Candidatus Eisenbacteria bacterium]
MDHIKLTVVGVTAIVLGAMLAGPAGAAITCEATGEAYGIGGGQFEYSVTITWGFMGYAVPERFDIALAHLEDCEFYNPDSPFQEDYIVPIGGQSEAAAGCCDNQGLPTEQIEWVGEMRFDEPDCWLPTLHVAFENTGSTSQCAPLSDGTGVFRFTSYGIPMPVQTYYGAVVIRAGDMCLVCDYTGPLPECNIWSAAETTSWGTIKGLYR